MNLLATSKGKHVNEGDESLAVPYQEDANIWHKRLAHIPIVVLRNRKVFYFKNKRDFVLDYYVVWPLARQTKVPFSVSTSRRFVIFY